MKGYSLIILFVLIIYSHEETITYCDDFSNPTSLKDCDGLPFGEDYEEGEVDYCCFISYKLVGEEETQTHCEGYSKAEYKNKDQFIREELEEGYFSQYDIVCNSSYFLNISLFTILLFIL